MNDRRVFFDYYFSIHQRCWIVIEYNEKKFLRQVRKFAYEGEADKFVRKLQKRRSRDFYYKLDQLTKTRKYDGNQKHITPMVRYKTY